MAMPVFSGEWPPKPWDDAAREFDIFTSWWTGDVDALETIYSSPNYVAPRPSQLMGGVRGALARFWYGKPMVQDQKRLHVPAASDIATTSADLLFGQPPSWLFNEGDAADLAGAQTRLNEIMDGADTVAKLLEAAELQAALGGVYLRLLWDKTVWDKVVIDSVAPDAAIPEWRYGQLVAVTFWSVVAKDKRGTWRHLEHHSPGKIEHALYLGDDGSIGREMPLESLDATKWAADRPVVETGVDGLTACYIPNVRPARRWRNTPGLSALGRSDFEGVEPLFDALDEVWSSWMRDIELAKGRLFVAEEALSDNGPGRGATFDPEQKIFTGVPGNAMLPEDGPNQMVQAQQFEIRVEEHAKTCDKLLKQILRAAGYSAGDFDDSETAGSITATEVSARKDKSNTTRGRKILYWQSELPKLASVALRLDSVTFGRPDYGIKADPEMKFPVRVDQDPVALSTAISNLRAARAISTETAVRMYHPNWSNEEVDEEVQRILEEQEREALEVPDPDGGEFEPAGEEPHSDLQDQVEPDAEVEEAA